MAETLFNRFDLDRKVREDQLYVCWEAWDRQTDSPVIVKTICFGGRHSEPFSPKIRKAIDRWKERRLEGTADFIDCLGDMERAAIIEASHEGFPLFRQLRERQRFDVEQALDLMQRLSSLLAAHHRKNLYHGTLRLENVFLDSAGRPILDDFGFLADAMRQVERVGTDSDGTIPERALNLVKFSPRNHFEFFRLGLILYFLLDGWDGRFQQRESLYYPAAISRQERLPDLKLEPEGISMPLNRLLARLIRKETKPFVSMQEVHREISRCRKQAVKLLAVAGIDDPGDDIEDGIEEHVENSKFDSEEPGREIQLPVVDAGGIKGGLSDSPLIRGMAGTGRKRSSRKRKESATRGAPVSKGLIATLVLLLALIPTSFLLSLEIDEVTSKNPLVQVPKVTGVGITEAREALENAGLEMIIASRNFSDGVPVNAVIRQTPDAGAVVRTGREIKISVSLGPSTRTMPNLVGHNLDEKRQVITETYGLRLGQIKRRVSNSPPGEILTQDPKPGAVVERGASIGLTVSLGPARESVRVPELTGMPVAEAIDLAGKAGLRVKKITKNFSYTALEETVYDQDPPAREVVAAGGTVELAVRVPDYGVGEETRFFKIAVHVPVEYQSVRVKVILSDDNGRNKIHDRVHRGGESWEKGRIAVKGLARYQVLFDDELRFEYQEIRGGR
jgi:beta-lactam-binding protein with PASTA domain